MNEVEDVAYYQSPLGIILLKANKEAITIVSFQDAEPASIVYSNSSLLQMQYNSWISISEAPAGILNCH